VLLTAAILGGPIDAAIAAMIALPSLVVACILIFFVRLIYSPANRYYSLGLGIGLYAVSIAIILICLNEFGPSQIM